MPLREFRRSQKLPVPVDEAWRFLADPRNLATITPPELGFSIRTDPLPEEMHAGLIIVYRIRPLANIPLTWITEITHLDKPRYFVDKQRFGPYAFWHHQHALTPVDGGTAMTDTIHFKAPAGPLGDLLAPWLILPKLRRIFDFRERKLRTVFGSP